MGEGLSIPRAEKSRLTRKKIIRSAKELLATNGYDNLSIRNICKAAGVSNGTFYHFFSSKDDLLSEFLMQDGEVRDDGEDLKDGLLEYIMKKYHQHIDDCMQMGLEFTSSYYTPKNASFNIYTRRPGNYPIDLYGPKLKKAQEDGYITDALTVHTIREDIRSIVVGNVFIWCSSEGNYPLHENLDRLLRLYLNTVFTEAYFKKYPFKKAAGNRPDHLSGMTPVTKEAERRS